jgi:hypothetical protein
LKKLAIEERASAPQIAVTAKTTNHNIPLMKKKRNPAKPTFLIKAENLPDLRLF